MKVGVFTVGLPDLTPEEAAREIKDAGYDGVEWRVTRVPDEVRYEEPSFWGNNLCTLAPTEEEASRARRVSEEAGLEVPGIGTYVAVGDIEAAEEAMRFARTAGAPQVRVGVGAPDGSSYEELFSVAKEFLRGVEDLAGSHGVKALVEIHHKTICPSASLAHRLVSAFDPDLVGVIFDPGNMAQEGFEDYRIGAELLGPYLAHVHIKNAAFERPEGGGVWRPRWSPLEDGVVDFGGVFEALEGVGYDGWLVIEDFSDARPSREALRHNLGFVRTFLERAGAGRI
ncbi:TIM barrel protein [Rubrobacter tropicus]|uniref:TIM barrel protein n=1 Tax=Rubrobacter tropicus TaxID=2653851 RepID=A0A6G8Q5E5_9ACTN|nr:sugar phosphate isomerase/epimerase family protein [Rubrobacter tropicus]QIN81547.1 TIM barrel protein [Rubrobacter tropicus]